MKAYFHVSTKAFAKLFSNLPTAARGKVGAVNYLYEWPLLWINRKERKKISISGWHWFTRRRSCAACLCILPCLHSCFLYGCVSKSESSKASVFIYVRCISSSENAHYCWEHFRDTFTLLLSPGYYQTKRPKALIPIELPGNSFT